jgi:F-type H+-transporting ATPase subunit b
MIYLANFTPILPDFGLIFWTVIFFGLFWFLIGKYAFGPIRDALKKREGDIQAALDEAKLAREEMADLKAENEKVMNEAREERAKILREAKETKDAIVSEARDKAKEEAKRIVNNAKAEIDNQKKAALVEVKSQAGMMALAIAEKVIKKQLTGDSEQEKYANSLVDEIKLN